MFPVYEIEWGEKYTLNIKIKEKKPIVDYLKLQGRFRHLTAKEIALMQDEVDHKWKRLLECMNGNT
jgi:pyruvate/2-oxoacid:ferredoxin oxidoreductase beta subunit